MTDILSKLRDKNRTRANVAPRNDVLIVTPETQEQLEEQIVSPTEIHTVSTSKLDELKLELKSIPETCRHSAIVLEKDLDQDLTQFCKSNRITVEVFLEAAWTLAENNSELQTAILAEAKRRYALRKQAGKLRRLITMLEAK